MAHQTLDFFRYFLNKLQKENIIIAHLRHKEIDESVAFEGDYDFITKDSNKDTIMQILFYAVKEYTNIHFVINRVKYGKLMIYLYSAEDKRPVILEIWSHLDVKCDNTLGYILYEDMQKYIQYDNKKGYSLRMDFEALYYLSHLKSKKKDLAQPLIQHRLHYYKNVLEKEYPAIAGLYSILLNEPQKRDEIAQKANAMLVEMHILYTAHDSEKKKSVNSIRRNKAFYRTKAQLLKKIKIIPVVGPDGVGKTTLIERLKSKSKSKIKYYRFKNLFRHNILYQITSYYFKRKGEQKLAKNQFDDVHGDIIISIASIYYNFLALRTILSKKFYFSDRFFHDFLIQDTRFLDKKAKLRDDWQRLLQKVPQTFWFIHLDAPSDIILARKDELNREAIDSYRDDIFTLYLQKPTLIYSYINTSMEIEDCANILADTAKSIGMKVKK